MNIFCTSQCPLESARWLPDRLVVKMPLEYCQMLAACFTQDKLASDGCPRTKKNTSRVHTHLKHPCTVWTLESRENMLWLIDHTREAFEEKYRRYPDNGRHFTHDFFDWVVANIDSATPVSSNQTEFPVAISKDSKCRSVAGFDDLSVINKYRLYIIHDKSYVSWKLNKPYWFP